MSAEISSNSLLDALELAKWVFAVLYVVSTIGVAIGVHWEGDQFPKSKQLRGHKLLIWSLAADTLFTIFIFSVDGWISHIQRGEIITLETRLLPRYLGPEAQNRISERICPFGPKSFNVLYIDSGDALFPTEFVVPLETCKWISRGGIDVATAAKIGVGPIGIQFVYDSSRASEFSAVADELAKALEAENIIASARGVKEIAAPYNANIIVVFGRR